jgi:Ca2+-binding RTX toxin-like protein
MRSWGGIRRRATTLAVAAMALCAAVPSAASASTLGNGVYTAGTNEGNVIQVTYEPDTASYRFRVAAEVTDTDGPGGCSVVGFSASCPASAISRIVVNTADRSGLRNYVSVGTNGFVPPIGLSEANQVRIPVDVHGAATSDVIAGGWGADRLSGGPGSDVIDGNEGSYLGSTPDSQIQASDRISCGTGDDVGDNGFGSVDTALMGPGDVVEADCEAVQQMVKCPRSGPDCSGVAPVNVMIPVRAGAAASGGKRALKTIVLGVGKFKLQSGQSSPVTTRLRPNRVRRVLRKTTSVRAQYAALFKHHGQRKLLDRTRFRLAKGG